ncbi:MAG: glycosyltransferase family 4 protein [Rhizobiales bacterium]|nr:glycosyltransferase family 4 protein [Hyphomicrobiales bacterium]
MATYSAMPERPLKVLLVSLFHPELVRGGAQQVCYELFQGLKDMPGVEPVLLASVDDSVPALYKSGARITGFDRRPDEYVFLSRNYDYTWHRVPDPFMIDAYVEFLRLIRPDVVHFHHFLTLGIDLLTITRRILPKARIVFTLHEFLSICAADGQMVRKTDKSLCTQPSGVRCHQCLPHLSPDFFFLREMWMKKHFDAVDVFTTPTRFMVDHFAKWGLDPNRITVVGNGQADYSGGVSYVEERESRNRFGFFGQLVDNKGVHVILEAVELLRGSGFTDFVVEINGDNLRYASEPRRKAFEAFMEREVARAPEEQNVVMNGSYHVDQLASRMSRVDWCIVPSVWWEIFGLVISEAWMFKRPVIASNVGGMKERIRHEVDGLHFNVGDARSLAETMRRACSEDGLWERLVGGIRPPASREAMSERFLEIYESAALPVAASA